ncbi:FRG domain-containing protein [Phaeobacter italicus]|uniref:FRG domain-containing protein n=1 Tax=Phaeobacter italicus TaxID=481446 RepID=UPI001CD5CD87|nr:FRG domain-containing protein [Phaeobacter italicus]MCA0858792.1 FRG domain-containing protein [Phaeobacter italicus]
MSQINETDPIGASLLYGRSVFEAYTSDQFSSDASYRRFARNNLKSLGLMNPVESHAMLYDTIMLPESEVSVEDRTHGCPQPIAEIGIDKLGLCWIDPEALREHFELSYFTEMGLGEAFARPFLCDPFYGLAIVPVGGRWVHASFTLDWLPRRKAVIGDQILAYLRDPSRILGDGAEAARLFWSDLVDDPGRTALAQATPAELRIDSMDQLRDLAIALKQKLALTNGNSKVWFRGQVSEYLTLDRSAAFAQGCLPYANVRDASLVTSLYRNAGQIGGERAAYRKFLIDIMAWESAAETVFGPAWVDVPLYGDFPEAEFGDGLEFSSTQVAYDKNGNVVGGRTRHTTFAKSAWQRGLLLQQYGCPTPFLDVTSSIDIAHWFATHKFEGAGSSPLYSDHSWGGDDLNRWPTIYCFILAPRFHPIVESTRLNSDDVSTRVLRQHCGLLGGGGLLARNYAARYIGLKLRLHPSLAGQSKIAIEDLFPAADTDLVYRELLKISKIGTGNQFPLYGI